MDETDDQMWARRLAMIQQWRLREQHTEPDEPDE